MFLFSNNIQLNWFNGDKFATIKALLFHYLHPVRTYTLIILSLNLIKYYWILHHIIITVHVTAVYTINVVQKRTFQIFKLLYMRNLKNVRAIPSSKIIVK